MGAQIAAHFANAGVPSLLLDLTAEAAAQGLQRARTLKPDPFFTADTWKLITTASFDEGLKRMPEADWILEAVVERLDVKRSLLEKVDAARRPGSIVTYDTVLKLKGPLGLADPLLARSFKKIGDRAAAGLETALAGERFAESVS